MQSAKSKLPGIFFKLSIIFFLISGYLIWQRYYALPDLSFVSPPPAASASKLSALPATLTIPDLDISLPVVPTQIRSGTWPTTTAGVSYLLDSARPGQAGNSIFYGHNWPRLLGHLRDIKPGQQIVITDTSGKSLFFWVSRTDIVRPSDISVLRQGDRNQLTLYTCYGLADSQRFVVTAYTQTPK